MIPALKFLIVAVAISVLPVTAFTQAYPTKPIKTISTIAGSSEVIARIIAQRLTNVLAQPVIVETQSGAGGAIGAQMVARAAPDGYTLLFTSSSALVVNQFLSKNTGFDSIKQFTPIVKSYETPLLIVANNSLPVNNMKELVDYAKRNPGKLSYGTSGVGTMHHLSGEQIRLLTGIDWVHVPYKRSPPVVTETITGRIELGFTVLSNVSPFLTGGKLKILAVNNDKRLSILPNIPTVSEQLPGYEALRPWTAYFGPAGLPQSIVQRLYEEIVKIMNTPEVESKLKAGGYVVSTGTAEEVTALMQRDFVSMGKLVKSLGIAPE